MNKLKYKGIAVLKKELESRRIEEKSNKGQEEGYGERDREENRL